MLATACIVTVLMENVGSFNTQARITSLPILLASSLFSDSRKHLIFHKNLDFVFFGNFLLCVVIFNVMQQFKWTTTLSIGGRLKILLDTGQTDTSNLSLMLYTQNDDMNSWTTVSQLSMTVHDYGYIYSCFLIGKN